MYPQTDFAPEKVVRSDFANAACDMANRWNRVRGIGAAILVVGLTLTILWISVQGGWSGGWTEEELPVTNVLLICMNMMQIGAFVLCGGTMVRWTYEHLASLAQMELFILREKQSVQWRDAAAILSVIVCSVLFSVSQNVFTIELCAFSCIFVWARYIMYDTGRRLIRRITDAEED